MSSHPSSARKTTDHDEIRKWAEGLGGRPAQVQSTGTKQDPGILRLDFGEKDEKLEEISWSEFFRKFDESGLALLYQQSDPKSRFNKFVER